MGLSILLHQSGDDPIQKVKNAGAVTVDKRCGHADEFPADAIKLRHGIALSTVIVVLVQLITEKAADPSTVLFLEVGAQREAAVRALDAIRTFRMLRELPQLIQNVFVFVRLRCMAACGRNTQPCPPILSTAFDAGH